MTKLAQKLADQKAAISRKHNKKIKNATTPAQAAAFMAVKTRKLNAIG